jgi:hypothetical protein
MFAFLLAMIQPVQINQHHWKSPVAACNPGDDFSLKLVSSSKKVTKGKPPKTPENYVWKEKVLRKAS